MKIALDAMSGDFAPISTVKGAIEALEEIEGLEIILVGKEGIIKEELKKYKYDTNRIEIKNADEIIVMTDDPVKAVREKKDSSMNVCIDLVKEKPNITIKEICLKLKVSRPTIYRDMKYLKESNILEYQGSSKKGKWVIKK